MRVSGLFVAGPALVLLLVGCATTSLQPPENPLDPRGVFVLDHGRHSSIALETASGSLVRYSYGDTRYYRDQDTSLWSGAAALLWPTPATLGRAELLGVTSLPSLRAHLVVGVEEILVLEVAGQHADLLMAELDGLHHEGVADHVVVESFGLVFAPHPRPYAWWHNSSTVIAGWLTELGVEQEGPRLFASWEIARD